MSTEPINYEAVIADLEAKRAQLDATITMLRAPFLLSGIRSASFLLATAKPNAFADSIGVVGTSETLKAL